MKEYNFTPEQSEMILNTVNETVNWYGNTYVLAKNLHNLCTQYIQSNIKKEETAQEIEETVLHLTPLRVSDILSTTEMVTNLLYKIQEALECQPKNVSDKNINTKENYGLN